MERTAPDASFVLDVALRARRIRHGYSITIDPTGELMKGDRLQFSVLTSQPGYLYIAFCEHRHGPGYRRPGDPDLSVYPKDHGIVMAANVPTIAPDPRAEIVLDDSPGPETLYLILSQSELSQADPVLADAITVPPAGKQTQRCGAQLYRALAGPSRPGTGGAGGAPTTPETSAPQVGTLQRGVEIVSTDGTQIGIDADGRGIVVKRFDLKHVPAK
jgi:hypothetical protein